MPRDNTPRMSWAICVRSVPNYRLPIPATKSLISRESRYVSAAITELPEAKLSRAVLPQLRQRRYSTCPSSLKRALCLVAASRHRLGQHTRRDLPRHTPLVFAPAARALLAAIADDGIPNASSPRGRKIPGAWSRRKIGAVIRAGRGSGRSRTVRAGAATCSRSRTRPR
jgi:hypothetical protein